MDGMAFQILEDDIGSVIFDKNYNQDCNVKDDLKDKDRDEISKIVFDMFETEDFARVEKTALRGIDMDTQVDYAYQEIADILIEKGVLVK